jgi:trk system potassium uptake protein TrkA
VRFPKQGVVGTIIRGDEIILPRGQDVMLPGDDVIVFAMPSAIPEVEKLFA